MLIGRLLCIGWRRTNPQLGLALGILAGSCSLHAIAQESIDARTTSVTVPEMRVVDGDKQRYVHAPRATVRCGPASSYYATGLLEQGTAVEVYVETADGWSGIRPPDGSHNWVPAESLYLMPGGRVAEVAQDHVPAWVGAASESVEKLLFQTELAKSQTVAILDEAYRLEENVDNQEPTKKLWFKISPPQGEFRWIKTAMLGREPITPNRSEPTPNVIGTAPKYPLQNNGKQRNSPGKIVEKSKTDQGVTKANYQSEPNKSATLPKSNGKSKGALTAENHETEEANQGNLAWSDEDQQMERVQREIRREQAESERKIREAAPQGTNPSSVTSSKGKKSSIIKRAPSTSPSSNVASAGSPKGAAILRPRPTKPQSFEDRDWQLFQQRDVGPQDTDSMNHILGIFGMSLVDPNQIPGHPRQSVARSSGPRDGAIYSQSSPIRSVPTSALASRMNRSTPKNTLNTDRSIAGIDHLPKPSGRYAPSRFTRDYSSELGSNYNDSRYAGSTTTPWWKTQGPLFGSGISMSDELDNPDRSLAGGGFYGYDSQLEEALREEALRDGIRRDEILRDEASGDGSETRRIGSTMLASGTSMRTSENDSMLRATEEVERFRTPAIQDALTELSIIVSRPVEQWNLAPLRDSAMQWIERGETPLIRGEARLLLDRIERFELLRQRTGSYVTPSPLGPQIPMGPNPSYPVDRSQADRSPSTQSELSGWLVAVHTSLPGQPEFALTDDVGNVKAYVQPTTGLNLRRYTQQMVTVYGPQGYLPNLGAKQIVADRLVRLR